MNYDEQEIRAIVEEVLRRLRESPSLSAPEGRVVVAVGATVSQTAVEELAKLKEKSLMIVAVAQSFRREMDDSLKDWIPYRLGSLPADAQSVVAPELSLTDAAKLAMGVLDDPVPDALWRGLVGQIPVFASPGDGFSSDLPRRLRPLATAHRLACERLGVRWVERSHLWEAVRRRLLGVVENRPLVTEALVASLPEDQKELVLAPRTIVTPLARDMARRRGIALVRQTGDKTW